MVYFIRVTRTKQSRDYESDEDKESDEDAYSHRQTRANKGREQRDRNGALVENYSSSGENSDEEPFSTLRK